MPYHKYSGLWQRLRKPCLTPISLSNLQFWLQFFLLWHLRYNLLTFIYKALHNCSIYHLSFSGRCFIKITYSTSDQPSLPSSTFGVLNLQKGTFVLSLCCCINLKWGLHQHLAYLHHKSLFKTVRYHSIYSPC